MNVEILTIGDEVLSGITVNTNAAEIGDMLLSNGWTVRYLTTVGDNAEDIADALKRALLRSEIILLTGGLGPTHDDITIQVLCDVFNTKCVFNRHILSRIKTRFHETGRSMPLSNQKQAMVPESAVLLKNNVGTAPGLYFYSDKYHVFSLPGVPREMSQIMIDEVLPRLNSLPKSAIFMSKIIRTAGISESGLADLLNDFLTVFPQIQLAFLPELAGVKLRISTSQKTKKACEKLLDKAYRFIYEKALIWIIGDNEMSLEKAVGDLLLKNGLSLSIAESCTGGLIGHKLTSIPGSSRYFERGIVAYSNEAKTELLGVSETLIAEYGAVSAETAQAMAEGVRKSSHTKIGLSVTGVAGPGGGTAEKPVGLVYIGYSDEQRSFSEKHRFLFDRTINKERAAYTALNLVRKIILNQS